MGSCIMYMKRLYGLLHAKSGSYAKTLAPLHHAFGVLCVLVRNLSQFLSESLLLSNEQLAKGENMHGVSHNHQYSG